MALSHVKLAFGVVLAACFGGLNIYLLTSEATDRQPGTDGTAQVVPDGGLPGQRERIDRVIRDVGQLDFDGCVDDLSQQNPNFQMAQVAGMSHLFGMKSSHLKQILGDRRVARLCELLMALPDDKASEQADRLFQAKFAVQKESWHAAIAGTGYGERWLADVYPHAAESALLLCALFCDREVFLRNADEWTREFDRDEPQETSSNAAYTLRGGLPDALLLMSLYLMVMHDGGESLESLNSRIEQLEDQTDLSIPTLKAIPVYNWSAHTNDTDFTHRHRGVPTDDKSILLNVVGLENWDDFIVGGEIDKHRAAARRMREWMN